MEQTVQRNTIDCPAPGFIHNIHHRLFWQFNMTDIFLRDIARFPLGQQFFQLWFDLIHRGCTDNHKRSIVWFQPMSSEISSSLHASSSLPTLLCRNPSGGSNMHDLSQKRNFGNTRNPIVIGSTFSRCIPAIVCFCKRSKSSFGNEGLRINIRHNCK